MGLLIDVYRSPTLGDCTNNGISARFDTLCVVNICGPFEPNPERYPAVLLECHHPLIVRIVPAVYDEKARCYVRAPGWHMMGGNFGATSDSRFSRAIETLCGITRFYGAVAIHDRVEG